MPHISVIVPIYNVQDFLEVCLDSILSQTIHDFELILINDGSEDRSGEICDIYAQKDDRIKVFHKENGGVSSARNVGLKLAEGKYICFVDPDDTIESNMYEVMISTAEKYNADLVVCPIRTFNSNTGNESVSSIPHSSNRVLNKSAIKNHIIPSVLENKTLSIASSVNKVYKKALFNSNNIEFEESKHHSEDVRLNFKLLSTIEKMVYVEQPFYNYFIRRSNSLTQTFRYNLYEYIDDNRKLMLDMCFDYDLESYQKKIRDHFGGVTLAHLQELVSSQLDRKEKKEIISKIINNNEFHEDLSCYESRSSYLSLMKILCTYRKVNSLIKLIETKSKVQQILNLKKPS
ncbi:glycosyltransferase [Halobacillus andaensis]|uniref:glycosyltransferase n=1 Tax=Halobacillus andaensis TaxID=1176239 RepID=UPI003D741084